MYDPCLGHQTLLFSQICIFNAAALCFMMSLHTAASVTPSINQCHNGHELLWWPLRVKTDQVQNKLYFTVTLLNM